MTIIAMFSGPRNISTTMMRAFENRPDTTVYDEPFYACYLKESGAPHPMRDDILAAQASDRTAVAKDLRTAAQTGAIQFQKNIAFHFADDAPLNWIDGAKVFHLIRDPRAMVASYAKKYEDVTPIAESYRVQRKIDDVAGGDCPVVDAADVLRNPEGVLKRLCAALDVPFDAAMLSWPAGPRDSDGVWAPHWYDAVWASTGFKPYAHKAVDLSPSQDAAASACMDDYTYFHERRLTAS